MNQYHDPQDVTNPFPPLEPATIQNLLQVLHGPDVTAINRDLEIQQEQEMKVLQDQIDLDTQYAEIDRELRKAMISSALLVVGGSLLLGLSIWILIRKLRAGDTS